MPQGENDRSKHHSRGFGAPFGGAPNWSVKQTIQRLRIMLDHEYESLHRARTGRSRAGKKESPFDTVDLFMAHFSNCPYSTVKAKHRHVSQGQGEQHSRAIKYGGDAKSAVPAERWVGVPSNSPRMFVNGWVKDVKVCCLN